MSNEDKILSLFSLQKKFEALFGEKLEVVRTPQVSMYKSLKFVGFTLAYLFFLFSHPILFSPLPFPSVSISLINLFISFQQREAPRFLAHFKGRFIIHKVTRASVN
jgi:hypothetical protein